MQSEFPTRRRFLQTGATVSAGVMAASWLGYPRRLEAGGAVIQDDVAITSDPRVKPFIQRGIDAAISAGASYADVRLTHTQDRNVNGSVSDSEDITVGVRAFMKGYWGFASGPVWTGDEAARLGKDAALQAKMSGLAKERQATLAPVDTVRNGHWVMPVQTDPFAVHPNHILDIFAGLVVYARRLPNVSMANVRATFTRQDKAFGASNESYWTQRTYRSSGFFMFQYVQDNMPVNTNIDMLSVAGRGLELFDEAAIRAEIDREHAEIVFDFTLPVLPVDVGRYETLFDATSVAGFLSGTVGSATELDRAIGFEANAGGTSYLNDPETMLGSQVIGSPMLSVTAERSTPGGAATVKWDDEGVPPSAIPLVTNGVLTAYQTTREDAAWLVDARASKGTAAAPARSSGSAYAPAAVDAPLAHTANLVMRPGADSATFESIMASVKKGLAFKRAGVSMDFQQASGFSQGKCYDVRNGKQIARVANAGILFRSPELWKGVRALGGAGSVRDIGIGGSKGEPPQSGFHTAYAVPMLHEQLTIIDIMRKA